MLLEGGGGMLQGDCVSIDKFECKVGGRLPYTKEKEYPQQMFLVYMFIDQKQIETEIEKETNRNKQKQTESYIS